MLTTKTSTCFASAAALLAMMAFKQNASLKLARATHPLLRSATAKDPKGTKSVTQTQDVAAVVTAANAFIATLRPQRLN